MAAWDRFGPRFHDPTLLLLRDHRTQRHKDDALIPPIQVGLADASYNGPRFGGWFKMDPISWLRVARSGQ